MAVGGGSQGFSVQLNLNWFVFNTGDFFLSFKEVALQKGESSNWSSQNSAERRRKPLAKLILYTILLWFCSGLVGPGESEENFNTCHWCQTSHWSELAWMKIGQSWKKKKKKKRTAKSCIWFFWRDEIAHKKSCSGSCSRKWVCDVLWNLFQSALKCSNSGNNTKYEQIIKRTMNK